MGVYTSPHAGNKVYRTKVPINDTHRQFDLTYGEVFPVMAKFALPGDVWKIGANALIRYKKMLSPSLTKSDAFFRFFFVPLRQVVDNIESIITGSTNGALIEDALPECENFIQHFKSVAVSNEKCVVRKNSFWAALGMPFALPNSYIDRSDSGNYKQYIQNYEDFVDNPYMPADYWYKAYCKIIFEYFRDENYQSFDGDFDKFYDYMVCSKGANNSSAEVPSNGWYYEANSYKLLQSDTSCDVEINGELKHSDYGVDFFKLWFCDLRKDYFMSSLPWIMKGSQPTINSVMHVDFSTIVDKTTTGGAFPIGVTSGNKLVGGTINGEVLTANTNVSNMLFDSLSQQPITDGGFNAQDVRDMFAETRVFERLARCGSRYVEYLEANFGIAPRDDTLQRPLYLGGFRQPIVTTEVVQTGGSTDEVGSLRGHGISSYGNKIKPFVCSEFGLIFGLMYVTPKTEYLFQCKKEYGYKKRFDFFNPSFQLLSEQQVNSSEYFLPLPYATNKTALGELEKTVTNFFTYGYQGMYNELRYDNDLVLRSMVDTESYWTQAINPFELGNGIGTWELRQDKHQTPPLNGVNMCIGTWLPNLLRPFESIDHSFKPMIVDFANATTVFRPMVKDPIPSLVDHN